MKEYRVDHTGILTDTAARSPHFSRIEVRSETEFSVTQTIVDPDGHHDWELAVTGEWVPGAKPRLVLVRLGPIGSS